MEPDNPSFWVHVRRCLCDKMSACNVFECVHECVSTCVSLFIGDAIIVVGASDFVTPLAGHLGGAVVGCLHHKQS